MIYYALITLFLILSGYILAKIPGRESFLLSRETAAFGYMILSSFFGGKILKNTLFPQITGYLLIGILVGPSFLSIVDKITLSHLGIIDEIALALIAFAAGAKVDLLKAKKLWKDITGIIILQILLVFVLVGISIPFLIKLMKISPNFKISILIFLVLATAAVAKSPATTIAIILETKAEGTFTDIIIGVTIIKDIVIIFLFTMVTALISSGKNIQFSTFANLSLEILNSIVLGVVFAALIVAYFNLFKGGRFPFILGTAFLISAIAHHFHFHSLLACMVAGIGIKNFSSVGKDFLKALEASSLPILIVFFSISGASLDFSILKLIFPAAIFFVIVRIISLYIATYLGAREPRVKKYGWMGFVAQAGLTLGFASLVGTNFPLYGNLLKNLIISAVIITTIIGPPLFNFSLKKAGETK